MTEIKHDPLFPYAVVSLGQVKAYARYKDQAEVFASKYLDGEVIDTTPKPKIPDDAEFIYWSHGKTDYYARKESGYWFDDQGEDYGLTDLLEWIGDAEVTVLVRKDES